VKPRLLDLFCGAGGAAMGYHRAGFDVVGVDIKPQPRYPFKFWQADALQAGGLLRASHFDAIHASPPCQPHVKGLRAVNAGLGRAMQHTDLIAATRELLQATGLPYILENVEGAPLIDPVRLCGTSFGLPLRRHRLFESSVALLVPPCAHGHFLERRYWTSWVKNGERVRASTVQVYGNGGEAHEWGPAMGIDWMARAELAEAIPPAYTEWIGRQLLASLKARQYG
jgi:DNA (cytosine-5)-methyltransferase 1